MQITTAWKVSKYGVFSGPHFPAFRLNTEKYEVSFRIQSECGKIWTTKNSVFGHFSRSDHTLFEYNSYFLKQVTSTPTIELSLEDKNVIIYIIALIMLGTTVIWIFQIICSKILQTQLISKFETKIKRMRKINSNNNTETYGFQSIGCPLKMILY